MKLDIWKVATIALVMVVIVMGVVILKNSFSSDLSATAAVDKALKFINEGLSATNKTAALVSTNSQKMGTYQFTINFDGQEYVEYVTADGKILFNDAINITESAEFSQKEGVEICKENDKPIVYFFGSKNCPHCVWEEPIIRDVVAKFGDNISFHENIDTDRDTNVFSEYSDGSIPVVIIGCKYYRVGSGELVGEAQERVILTKNICSITGNLPADICQ